MKKQGAFAKIRFDKETKIINAFFHYNENWDNNSLYQETIKEGNFFEASEQEYFLCVSGKQFCYIDGKIQEYVEPLEVKLENAKALKNSELSKIYAIDDTWKCILKDGVGSIERSKNWIFINISTKMQFRYDSGEFFEKKLSSEDIDDIKNQLNDIGWKIFNINIQIKDLISNAKTIEEIQAIDIQKEFSSVEKVITIK